MEAKRDLSQSIVHVDMDAFYANVEMLYNPDLAGKPFAVVRHRIASCHTIFILMDYFSPKLLSNPGRTRNCHNRIVRSTEIRSPLRNARYLATSACVIKTSQRGFIPEFVAKALCKDLIIVPVDYKRVGEQSRKIMIILKDYDPNMYIAGCDEAYLKCVANDHHFRKTSQLNKI